jgi:hypothetical protein
MKWFGEDVKKEGLATGEVSPKDSGYSRRVNAAAQKGCAGRCVTGVWRAWALWRLCKLNF